VKLFQLPSKGVKIVYVVGNHDIDFCELSISGTPIEPVYPRLHLDIDGTSFDVEHGHFYDPSINVWPAAADFFARWAGKALDKVGPRFEDALGEFKALVLGQRFDTTGQKGVGWKEKDLYWQAGCKLACGEHDYVVLGHTHDSCLEPLDVKGKTLDRAFYVNAGDWQVHSVFAFFKDKTMRVFDRESQREDAIEFAST
jgi:UDP-2,3-diacylglucosamine pyrophosphatase LpxH